MDRVGTESKELVNHHIIIDRFTRKDEKDLKNVTIL